MPSNATNAKTEYQLRVVDSVAAIDPAVWDRLAAADGETAPQPFLRHAFFHAVEASGSACADSGWLAQHLILETKDGDIRGLLPLYLKNHSQGEYIFDHAWADAFQRAGGRYYPKLVSCIPFTPVAGRRIFTTDLQEMVLLLNGAQTLADKHGISSVHFNFLPAEDWQQLGEQGYLLRTDQQFHWLNDGYKNFDEFLAALASRKRKAIKKERDRALQNGISVEWVSGDQLTPEHWDAFFQFYIDTGNRKWGHPYLTRDFFTRIGETMSQEILLIFAKRDNRYIAGALNFIGAHALYGRNWGCIEDHPFLHFEICYYQAIEFAIANGLACVEAGAQGSHKLARGYAPTRTHSAHYIAHAGLRRAIAEYLESEREFVDSDIETLATHLPFKKEQEND